MPKYVTAGELASSARRRGRAYLLDAARMGYGLDIQTERDGLKLARVALSPFRTGRVKAPDGQVRTVASWIVGEVRAPQSMPDLTALLNSHVFIQGYAPDSEQAESDMLYRDGLVALEYVVHGSERPVIASQDLGRVAGLGFRHGGTIRVAW